MEITRKKNVASRVLVPMINSSSRPTYQTAAVGTPVFIARSFQDGQANALLAVTGVTITHAAGGLHEVFLPQAFLNPDTGADSYIILKISGTNVDEQSILIKLQAFDDKVAVDSNLVQMGGVVQSATDLKDFADAGYDPATNSVEQVKVNDDMRGTDGANTVVPMTAALSQTEHDNTQTLIAALNDISVGDVDASIAAGLVAIGLDHLISSAVVGADVANNSIIAQIVSKAATADWDTFVNTTDSLEAIKDALFTTADQNQIRHRLNIDGVQAIPVAGGAAKMAGNDADLTLKSVVVSNSAGNAVQYISTGAAGHGLQVTGNAGGHGIDAQGGTNSAGGDGIHAVGNSSESPSFGIIGIAGGGTENEAAGIKGFGGDSGAGIQGEAVGVSDGIHGKSGAGATGSGAKFESVAANGNGLELEGGTVGDALKATALDGDGIHAQGGEQGNGIVGIGDGIGDGVVGESGTGATGSGMRMESKSTNGHGIETIKTGSGIDLKATDHGDGSWEGDAQTLMISTTINALTTQKDFTLVAGSADDNAYNGCIVVVQDAATAAQKAVGVASDYVGLTKQLLLFRDPGVFTMAPGDKVSIIAAKELKNQQTLEGVIAGKVNTIPGAATTLLVKELTNDAEADLNKADLEKNRVLTFITGVCKGQSVSITDQAAAASDPITLTVTTMVNFANIAVDDEFIIT